ncbi:MAG TPA: DUF6412 domain-containing protein [Jatrophihabitantaceae bacterium]|jgi:hypothetical protein
MNSVRWSVQGRLAVVVTAAVMLAASVAPMGPGTVPAVPLAMAILVVAACVVAWRWVVRRPSLAPAASHSARVDLGRNPVRQCDPDAAGHVRPRAPGARR